MSSERFIRTEMLLGREAVKKLSLSRVAVVGLGGVGSWCAEALARSGVGELTLIDGAAVSVSNINRQVLATSSTVGRPKADVLAERLLEINPAIKVKAINSIFKAGTDGMLFDKNENYDYIADAIDTVSCKTELISGAIVKGIPIISSLGMGNKLDPAGLSICDIYETEVCPLARVMRKELRKKGILRHTVIYSSENPLKPEALDETPPGRRSVPGAVVWVTACAGMMIAGYIVGRLCGLKQ